MSYVDDAFDKLRSNLEISDTEQELASTRHSLIRDHISQVWDLEKSKESFLTGSYDRHTKTKKLKDVDIFVVIDPMGDQADLANGTGKTAVAALKKVLSTRWDDLESDDYVVRVNYAGEDVASYEVAPVFPSDDDAYRMPSGSIWMNTNPEKHAELVTAKNKECGGEFVPLVKMLKGINREAGEPIDPPFLIEVMALDIVFGEFQRHRDEIRFFLASAADRFTEDWPDPADIGPDVNRNISSARKKEVATIIEGWLAIAEEALLLENEGKDRAAVEKWRELFGWRMPKP